MHEIPQTYLDQQLAEGIGDLEVTLDRAGGHKVSPRLAPAPQARNGTPNAEYDNGRGYRPHGAVGMPNYGERCVGNSSCIPICPVQAKYTPLRTQAQCDPDLVAIATRRVVNRVLFRENGRATGVEYQVYDDPRSTAASTHYVTGSVVVLAAHAIENAKLLLASDVRNQAVGRHLMDHPLVVTQALVPEELSRNLGPHRGPAATSFIDQFRDGPWRESMAAFRVGVFNWGWGFKAESFSREVRALADHGTLTPTNGSDGPNSPMIGRKMRQALVEHMPRQFQLEFMLEQTPKWTNRVTIDRAHRDRLGNFRPVISYGIDEYVRAGVRQAIEVSEQINAKLGAKEWNFTPRKRTEHRKGEETVIEILQAGNHGHHYEVLGARHGAGTHLMGTEPTTSVVDEYQRCHQHQNLYAVGCGSMVTIGTSNPTLTGAMLALRSADQMHRDLMELNRPANIAARVG
ncbi:GMC oxidoreductase [Saccharopolyspora sp. NFXS83]|uniref:GMC oxidoreductase n=1 Tax=Saccharopolyspora sp. NFXS83 TaxID=2993560 RepID=UPI00224AEF2E|nr:GMC oxidoreductase [Saccharopolyspora sp. NFXS83]MCX2729274.1 GMC oxidoreductase [Saccharopolyspora sp. NFXS83]